MFQAVSKNSLRTISGSALHNCRPMRDRLCKLPRFAADGLYGPQCAYAMWQGATMEALSEKCTFRCHSGTSLIISEIEEDEYVLTHLPDRAKIHCQHQEETELPSMKNQPGAIQVKLPCDCNIKINDTILIPTRLPCLVGEASKVEITHVLPVSWTHLKHFNVNPVEPQSQPMFENVADCLNTNWSLQVPHISVTRISTAEMVEALSTKVTRIKTYSTMCCCMCGWQR